MKFSKKFMTDMNEILGQQSWGQYFCESSLTLFDKVYGDVEISYYENLNSIKTHPDVPKKEKIQWVKTVTMLQTNLDAIKYGDRFERLCEYRIVTPNFTADFTDLKTATDTLNIEINQYYSTNFNAGHFEYTLIIEMPDGVVMQPLSSFVGIGPDALIRVHSRSGKINIVPMNGLSEYLNSVIEEDKLADANSWAIYQKIKDIDDGFAAFEKIQ